MDEIILLGASAAQKQFLIFRKLAELFFESDGHLVNHFD